MTVQRVSDLFALGRTQPTLEFIDVDTHGDTRLFIDPSALKNLDSVWGDECVDLLQNFFSAVLAAIRSGADAQARYLLASLSEPNDTHLGLSRGQAKGSGMGSGLAREMWDALRNSQAVTSGLLSDLEDTILFIDHIGHDRISDITTNIIRGPLVEFTQDVCGYYGIPMQSGVAVRVWDSRNGTWRQKFTDLPMTSTGRLLLVPKEIVRARGNFDPGSYYQHYILPYYQDVEYNAGRGMVRILRNGRRTVVPPTKKSVQHRYGRGKKVNLDATLQDPTLLERYRADAPRRDSILDHTEIAAKTSGVVPNWDALLQAVLDVPPGRPDADAYEVAIEKLLTALFYPALGFPKRQHRTHQGRKRIDITYTNLAERGFFAWLHRVQKVACGQIAVECKNYSKELGNPELDQLTGRFGVNRGFVGILCHRGFGDKALLIERCRDAVSDGRGYVLILDDDDLRELVEQRKKGETDFAFLLARFQQII